MATTKLPKRIFWVACIGTVFEMYDFTLYSLLAATLAIVFFPFAPHDGIFFAYGILAIGYIARPIGAILAGNYGDVIGRKAMLLITIFAMAAPSLFIIALPGFQYWGISAAFILIGLRTLQGLAVGGEFSGSLVFIGEYASPKERTFWTATIIMSLNLGVLLAMGVAFILFHYLKPDQITSWGWRLAYFLGGIIALIGVYLRFKATETPEYRALKQENALYKVPVLQLFKKHLTPVMIGIILMLPVSGTIGTLLVFLPNYLGIIYHDNPALSVSLSALFVLVLCIAIPIAAKSCQIISKQTVHQSALILIILLSYPLFVLRMHQSLTLGIIALIVLGILAAMLLATFGDLLFELFPTEVRYSGISLTYNVPIGIITGLSPTICLLLIRKLHDPAAPAWFLVILAAISLIAEHLITSKWRKTHHG